MFAVKKFHRSWKAGWLQSVHNTFLMCLRDTSKSLFFCFSPAHSRDVKSCGYLKTRDLHTMQVAHNSMVRACYRYLEGRGSDSRWGLGSFHDHFFVVPNIYMSLICYFVNL